MPPPLSENFAKQIKTISIKMMHPVELNSVLLYNTTCLDFDYIFPYLFYRMLAAFVLGVCIVAYGIDGETITAENVSTSD